jgi:hypothetical protein
MGIPVKTIARSGPSRSRIPVMAIACSGHGDHAALRRRWMTNYIIGCGLQPMGNALSSSILLPILNDRHCGSGDPGWHRPKLDPGCGRAFGQTVVCLVFISASSSRHPSPFSLATVSSGWILKWCLAEWTSASTMGLRQWRS